MKPAYTDRILGMHWGMAFGIPFVAFLLITSLAVKAVGVPPLPTSGTNTVKTVPWLMATMDVETKQMVLTEPPAWMLAGPQTNEPTQVTIQIECMDKLTNVVVAGEFKTTRPVAFVRWKVIEE